MSSDRLTRHTEGRPAASRPRHQHANMAEMDHNMHEQHSLQPIDRLLLKHEGLRLKPYRDTVGKLTIGVGRNLDDNGITEEEALTLLGNDIERHALELEDAWPEVISIFAPARYDALLDMAVNMGVPRLLTFRRMWAAIEAGDWDAAAREALDSKWARQVGERANDIAHMLRTGEYPQWLYAEQERHAGHGGA